MSPPSWALAGARRLDLDGFAAEFSAAWSHMTSRFLKLECWQQYREADSNESQAAFDRGDVQLATELLRREAEADRPLYEDVRARGIEYARVRFVRPPLTDYLRYELLNYQIRAELGENIEIVRCGPEVTLPSEQYFDFLLFDQHTALIHDYGVGEVGHQTGGWLTREPATLGGLEETAVRLRADAESLRAFQLKG